MKQPALFSAQDILLQFIVDTETITAVKKSSLSIPENAITIIFGPSGSGKSSLLNVLSGLQPPTSGVLRYRDQDVYKHSNNGLAYFRAHELGIVYQTNYWVKSLTVLENVSMPLYFLGYSRTAAHAKARQALERVNMLSYAKKYPILLSGGEQQRVAMARAIVNDSPVVIADEPTGNLDSKNGEQIIGLLVDLHHKYHKTIILVTHNIEYLPIANHLLQIQDGTVSEIDQADIPKMVRQMLGDVTNRVNELVKENES